MNIVTVESLPRNDDKSYEVTRLTILVTITEDTKTEWYSNYPQTSNACISRALVGNILVDHSGAPVGDAPTIPSSST